MATLGDANPGGEPPFWLFFARITLMPLFLIYLAWGELERAATWE